jgi:1,4-alpha-glucan branching enzyme
MILRIVKAEEAGGYGLDAQWSDDFHHALFSVISGEHGLDTTLISEPLPS